MESQLPAKKLEKKKERKQGDESSGTCELPRTEAKEAAPSSKKQHLDTALQYHYSDHHKASLELDTKVGQLETRRQDTDFESLKSGVLSVRSHPSDATVTVMGKTTQYSEATPSAGKKKKKKKSAKSANIGILTSEINLTLPKANNEVRKETHKDKEGEEGANTSIIPSAESNVTLRKAKDKVRKESNKDKQGEGASTGIFSSELSNVTLQKPTEEEEKETHNNKVGENQHSEASPGEKKKKKRKKKKTKTNTNMGILTSKFNLTLPKTTDKKEKEAYSDDEEGDEAANTSILHSESNVTHPNPTEEEEKETHNHDEEGEEVASTSVLSFESNVTLPKVKDKVRKETHKDEKAEEGTSTSILSSESNIMTLSKPPKEEKKTNDHDEKGEEVDKNVKLPKPADEKGENQLSLEATTSPGEKKKKKKKKKKTTNMGMLTSELDSTLPKATDKEERETHNRGEVKENEHSEATTSPGEKKKKKKKKKKTTNTGILRSKSDVAPSKATDKKGNDIQASVGILQSATNVTLAKPIKEKEKQEYNHDEKGEEADRTGNLQSELNVTLSNPINEKGMEIHDHDEEGKETVVEASSQGQKPTDLERFSNESTLLTEEEKERQNLLQVLRLMYGVGLTALRNLFMDIHPTWSNTPGDALNLDQGSMRLKAHETASFNKGDINKWDISLITTVLRYSKKCNNEISKRPGFEDAIRKIRDYKNKLLSHPCNDKMSDADYHVYWSAISGHLETIGVSKEEIDAILEGNVLENGKVYRDLFLQEVAAQSAVVEEMRQQHQTVTEKLDTIIANQSVSSQSSIGNQLRPQRGGPNWDEWMRFRNNVRNFDHFQNNYVLITDAMSPELMECFSVFRSVPWKMVLDFDPSSEEKGMYQDFASKDGKNSLVNMITPAEVGRKPLTDLAQHIDPNKTQWMFVNGREDDGADGGPQDFDDWEDNAVGDISTFFKCCSEPDKLDKNKPLVCLVLPFRKETVPFINGTIKRLLENFKEFDKSFVQVKPKEQSYALPDKLLNKINIRTTELEPELLHLGMEDLFDVSTEQSCCMPTSQADVTAKLTQTEYLYLKEYLDLLCEGCEDLTSMIDVGEDGQKLEDLIEEHKKSFMSGNWISFVSLCYNHDAKREISNEIRTHIQRLLDQQDPTHSTIVEISHSPGSGGSTIARRVMWDIHKSYPCAFAKLEDHKFDLEDDMFLDSLADRISAVQETCHTTPVILLDGKHTRIEALSNRLVRILNSKGKRAVLLRCNHRLEESKAPSSILEYSDVHATFPVNVRLEESKADLKEFESKYKDYIKEFKNIRSLSDLSRVFHFPLFAMLKEFRKKLQEIIYESFDEMTDVEKEIVTVVAFIQRFAAQPIPAPLLYAIFKQPVQASSTPCPNLQGVTYEDISEMITERLCNLMVPANPARFIRSGRGFKRPNCFQEMYTLQHPVVAEMVLQKAKIALKRDTLALARDFLSFPIFDDIRFIPLMKDLFVRNGCGPGRFSVLFEELKVMHSHEAGDVFYEAAEKTNDVVVVTSAARFFAKVPPRSFTKAKELIEKAFECENAREKQKTIYDVKGVVLLKELKSLAKSGRIASLQHLQLLAQITLESFRNARTFPPSFPNPLIGEVKTWVICIEWITKNICRGNSIVALHFIMSHNAPQFFRACVSDSFHLLNIVDHIVQSVSLSDPETTQKEANNVRVSLMKAFMNTVSMSERRNASEIILECQNLCSAEIFRSSPQKELKRLQVLYVFSCVKEIENINRRGLQYLLELLKDLVEVEKEDIFANHLMRICLLINGPQEYSLDQGLNICKVWNKKSKYEALPHFYEMMIYFIKILDGDVMEFRARYLNALGNCREKSSHDCRKTISTHFLGKTGAGMTRLMTRNTLFRGETDYKSSINDAVYWRTRSRNRLLECRGRIRSRSSGGRKTHLTVELMPGNIELYVAKNAGIGSADRNFVPGSMVYFVVSFNLLGPVANGITFKSSLLSRQLSNS